MDHEDLFTVGEEILASARASSLPLDANGGISTLCDNGWKARMQGRALHASRWDEVTQSPAFLSEQPFTAPSMHLYCLTREFEEGKLAGKLRSFTVVESSPTHALIDYVSVLPWPLAPRHFRVRQRFGVVRSTGALLIVGESVPNATALAPRGTVSGACHYSYYHITRGPLPGQSVLRRIINIDLRLPLPEFVISWALRNQYVTDLKSIAKTLADWEGSSLQARLADREYYRPMEGALEATAGAPTAVVKAREEAVEVQVTAKVP